MIASQELTLFGAWFDSHTDTIPKPFEMTWPEFCEQVTGNLHVREDKFDNDSPGFNLAHFIEREGVIRRRNVHVDALSGIVLDFDKDYDPETVFAALDGCAWLAYTTFAHTPAAPRWRVIVPLATPIQAGRFKQVRAWLLMRINGSLPARDQKADEQAKAVSNFFFLPGCPAANVDHAEWRMGDGPVLEVPAPTDFRTGTPSVRLLGDKIDWKFLKARMHGYKMNSNKPEDTAIRRAFRAVLRGESFADHGSRDNTLLRMCGSLAGWAPGCDPQELASIFARSLHVMAIEQPDDPPPDIDNAADKIARGQAGILAQAREGNAEHLEDAQRIETEPPMPVELAVEQAEAAGLDAEQLLAHLVLRRGNSFFVWLPQRGEWSSPKVEGEALSLAHHELQVVPDVELHVRSLNGSIRRKNMAELLHDHGKVIVDVVADLRVQATRFDTETDTLCIVGAPRRPLEAEYDATVDAWFRALGGTRADKLLDWVAGLTWLDRPNSVLFLRGRPDVGKGLFMRGLSRVWNVDSPTLMKRVVANHGDYELQRCPLVYIDEGKWAKHVDVTALLREHVTQPSRTVNRKYHDPIELAGFLRFVVSANNFNLFSNDENALTPEDRDAIAQRFLEVEPDEDAAVQILMSLDPQERDGLAADDRISRHALWLSENREVVSPGRFVVSGERGGHFATRIVTEDKKWGSWVVEWLARYLSDPTVVEKGEGNLVHREDGRVIVSPEAIVNTFERVLKNKQRPQALEISNTLRSLSTGKLVPLPGDRGTGYEVIVDEVIAWSLDKGLGNPARIRANAAGRKLKSVPQTGATV